MITAQVRVGQTVRVTWLGLHRTGTIEEIDRRYEAARICLHGGVEQWARIEDIEAVTEEESRHE
jgi:hypothetical protein